MEDSETTSKIYFTSIDPMANVEQSVLFWLKQITLQLSEANDLQVERNLQLKRSVDLQEKELGDVYEAFKGN